MPLQIIERKLFNNIIKQQLESNETDFLPPNLVLESWEDDVLTLRRENPKMNIEGFRTPQLGAIYATLGFWMSAEGIGTIVMPTGTGKTETMLGLLVIEKLPKLLVVVPSDALREQISDKFVKLGILKTLKVLKLSALHPVVGILSSQFDTIADATQFVEQCNVVVATAAIMSALPESILSVFTSQISHLFIDEAHHSEATTWSQIRDKFQLSKILQFTATPYRNDGKRLKGKVIFDFPLRKAQEEGYFKPIQFVKVHEYNPLKADEVIALKAIEQLRKDREKYPHILMARVKSKDRANEVFSIYERFAEFKAVKIHTGLGAKKIQEVKQAILNLEVQIIVCVDMLGEGFDLPQLKIAAFHDIRKSLAITLQFTGRFTRSKRDEELGNATMIANLADIKVTEELAELYAQNVDWNVLLPDISHRKTQQEEDFHNYINGFKNLTDFVVSLQSLKPSMSTVIYKNHTDTWTMDFNVVEKGLPEKRENYEIVRHAHNPQEQTLVIVTAKKTLLNWTDSNDIFNLQWDLYVIFFDLKNNSLFIHSSDNGNLYQSLAKTIIGEDAELINGDKDGAIFRCFDGIKRFKLQNVGLIDVVGKLIRYNQHMGTDVEHGLTQSQINKSKKAVLFGVGYEKGNKMTLGCSYKGRIWSWRVNDLKAFTEWCKKIGDKVLDTSIDVEQLLRGALTPKAIWQRPALFPFSIDWKESMYEGLETRYKFEVNDITYDFFDIDLVLVEPSDEGDIKFGLRFEDKIIVQFELKLFKNSLKNPDFKIEQTVPKETAWIISGRKREELTDFLMSHTPTVWFTDGSMLDDGNSYTELKADIPPYEKEKIIGWDWTNVNLSNESQNVLPKREDSIQYKCLEILKTRDYDIIYDDDGSGEMADIVTIKKHEDKLSIELYHLKYARNGKVSADIKDLVEVCSQAQKSYHWIHKNSKELLEHLLRREALRQDKYAGVSGCSRIERGTKDDIVELLGLAKNRIPVEFEIYIVQPAIAKSKISFSQLTLLSVTEDYLKTKTLVNLKVIGSQE